MWCWLPLRYSIRWLDGHFRWCSGAFDWVRRSRSWCSSQTPHAKGGVHNLPVAPFGVPGRRPSAATISELETVIGAVRGFCPFRRHRVVHLMCNNSVMMSYIRKEGGTLSFQLTRLGIWVFKCCDWMDITLVPVHLPGSHNVQADTLSRAGQTLATEWAIELRLLNPVFSRWGTLSIDLFTTFVNKKLPVLASPFPDTRAKYIDAMWVLWSRMGIVYAFPPFKMLPAVLTKMQGSRGLTVILIAPRTLSALWMRGLLAMSQPPPIPLAQEELPLLVQEVALPDRGTETKHCRPLNLHAWRLWRPSSTWDTAGVWKRWWPSH